MGVLNLAVVAYNTLVMLLTLIGAAHQAAQPPAEPVLRQNPVERARRRRFVRLRKS